MKKYVWVNTELPSGKGLKFRVLQTKPSKLFILLMIPKWVTLVILLACLALPSRRRVELLF